MAQVSRSRWAEQHYPDPNEGGGGGGSLAVVRFAIPSAPGTTSSKTIIPSGSLVLEATLDVTAAYPAGTTITIGQAGAPAEFQAAGNNTPTVPSLYQLFQDTIAASTNPVLVTVAGPGGGTGAAFVIVQYVAPPIPA